MTAPRRIQQHAAGFTVIELLAVVAMVAVLALVATPSLRSFAGNQALSSTVSDLLSATMTARNAAISRNRHAIIEPMDPSTGWETGWRVYVDMDGSDDFDASTDEQLVESTAIPAGVVRVDGINNCTAQNQFSYDPNGFLKQIPGSNGGIGFKSEATGRERCVVINQVGRARICGTGIEAC